MARIRTIKPEMFGDEKLAPMAVIDRFVFIGLIAMADDAGRIVDTVRSIDGFVFPETDDTARESLIRLAAAGRILRYTSESGQRLIQIAKWADHQKVAHPSAYVLPAPSLAQLSGEVQETLTRDSCSDLGPRTKDQGPGTFDQGPPTKDQGAGITRDADASAATPLALVRSPETLPVSEPVAPSPSVRVARTTTRSVGRPGRTHEDIKASIALVMHGLQGDTERRLKADELRRFQAETVFAYWQVTCGKRRSLYDAERERLLVKRLTENNGNVDELFYAIDGGRTDPYVRDTRGCDLVFMLRNRSSVEEFASKRGGYTRDEPHPKAMSIARALRGEVLQSADAEVAHA